MTAHLEVQVGRLALDRDLQQIVDVHAAAPRRRADPALRGYVPRPWLGLLLDGSTAAVALPAQRGLRAEVGLGAAVRRRRAAALRFLATGAPDLVVPVGARVALRAHVVEAGGDLGFPERLGGHEVGDDRLGLAERLVVDLADALLQPALHERHLVRGELGVQVVDLSLVLEELLQRFRVEEGGEVTALRLLEDVGEVEQRPPGLARASHAAGDQRLQQLLGLVPDLALQVGRGERLAVLVGARDQGVVLLEVRLEPRRQQVELVAAEVAVGGQVPDPVAGILLLGRRRLPSRYGRRRRTFHSLAADAPRRGDLRAAAVAGATEGAAHDGAAAFEGAHLGVAAGRDARQDSGADHRREVALLRRVGAVGPVPPHRELVVVAGRDADRVDPASGRHVEADAQARGEVAADALDPHRGGVADPLDAAAGADRHAAGAAAREPLAAAGELVRDHGPLGLELQEAANALRPAVECADPWEAPLAQPHVDRE